MQVEAELRGEILFATLRGKLGLESTSRAVKQVFDSAVEKRVHKILLNALGVSGVMSTIDRYEIAVEVTAHLTRVGLPAARIALVGIPPSIDGFAVEVGKNRGVTVEVFPSVEQALYWLSKWP